MSVFDFPRINVKGTIQLDPGTANNDDYAASATLPDSYGPYAGQPLGLLDSKDVSARTYGMTDDEYIAWVQKAQTFDTGDNEQTEIIPAEWNYYGGMGMKQVSISVVGAQQGSTAVGANMLVGTDLRMKGSITDINPEGSPPATQFFIQELSVGPKNLPFIDVTTPSKGVGQWINFFRNVNLTADAGAGSYVYHAMPGATIRIPAWETLGAIGIVFRYYLSRALLVNPDGGTNAGIEALYEQQEINPKDLELVGTIAPLYAQDTLVSPTGRLMTWAEPNITTPTGHNNGGGTVALGPGVVHRSGDLMTADFSGTFPDNYNDQNGNNPKFNFGTVTLQADNGTDTADIGTVNYADTAGGNALGWLFDFDVSAGTNPTANSLLNDPDTALKLVSADFGDVLAEDDYYFVTNQLAVYGEQLGSGTQFINNGTPEAITLTVFRRGNELPAGSCPPILVWQYQSVPLQSPGDAELIASDFQPGQALTVGTSQPGNLLFTFAVNDPANPPPADFPPESYSTFMNPPYVTNAPQISLRILPNENFEQYFIDPKAKSPVANESLTFDILYAKVLRVYYLLYPVMRFLPLNSESAVNQNAAAILQRIDPAIWMTTQFMPRTRDMSDSRRRLLQAWCNRALQRSRD